jgi:hypothetical protein
LCIYFTYAVFVAAGDLQVVQKDVMSWLTFCVEYVDVLRLNEVDDIDPRGARSVW